MLSLDVGDVAEVLIAGKWYPVVSIDGKSTFGICAYTMVEEDRRVGHPDVVVYPIGWNATHEPEPAYMFQTSTVNSEYMAGPVSAIQSLRYRV